MAFIKIFEFCGNATELICMREMIVQLHVELNIEIDSFRIIQEPYGPYASLFHLEIDDVLINKSYYALEEYCRGFSAGHFSFGDFNDFFNHSKVLERDSEKFGLIDHAKFCNSLDEDFYLAEDQIWRWRLYENKRYDLSKNQKSGSF